MRAWINETWKPYTQILFAPVFWNTQCEHHKTNLGNSWKANTLLISVCVHAITAASKAEMAPVWVIICRAESSMEKQETTLRPKIHRQLPWWQRGLARKPASDPPWRRAAIYAGKHGWLTSSAYKYQYQCPGQHGGAKERRGSYIYQFGRPRRCQSFN